MGENDRGSLGRISIDGDKKGAAEKSPEKS